MLLIEHQAVRGRVLLRLTGELRAPAGDQLLLNIVRQYLPTACGFLLLDLEKVTDVDAAGIGALVSVRNLIESAGGRLALVRPSRWVAHLLEITNLLSLLDVVSPGDAYSGGTFGGL
jgi:anti-anti-sigma factor